MARKTPCKLPPPPVLSPLIDDKPDRAAQEWEQWFSAVHDAVCDVEPIIQTSGPTQINNIFMGDGDGSGAGEDGSIYLIQNTTAVAASGGYLVGVEFTNASGNWTVPTGVSSVWVTMIASGGGGASTTAAATGGNGGGAGESIEGMLIKVTSGGTIAYAIPGLTNADTDGTDSTFGFLICKAGKKGTTSGSSGAGGGTNGAVATAGNSIGVLGTAESNTFFGGSSGGGRGTTTVQNGSAGGPAGGRLGSAGGTAGGSQAGGGGGASTRYAAAQVGAAGGANATDAASTDYGVGGAGAGGHAVGKTGGKGGPGYLLITYVGTP